MRGELSVTERPTNPLGSERDPTKIDTSVVHAARVYEYMLGGTTNFTIDRQAAELLTLLVPGGLDTVRLGARANRAFLINSVLSPWEPFVGTRMRTTSASRWRWCWWGCSTTSPTMEIPIHTALAHKPG